MNDDRKRVSNDNESTGQPERFESDSDKIIHRHLENEHDEITEEDIRNVRIGMTPPGSTSVSNNPNEEIEKRVTEISEETTDSKDAEKPSDEPITPWDTIEP